MGNERAEAKSARAPADDAPCGRTRRPHVDDVFGHAISTTVAREKSDRGERRREAFALRRGPSEDE